MAAAVAVLFLAVNERPCGAPRAKAISSPPCQALRSAVSLDRQAPGRAAEAAVRTYVELPMRRAGHDQPAAPTLANANANPNPSRGLQP